MNEDSRREPGLFDLPLEPPQGEPTRRPPLLAPGEILPLFSDEEIDDALSTPFASAEPVAAPRRGRARPTAVPDPPPPPPLAALGRRCRAAAGDLAVLFAAGVVAALGASALGVSLSLPGAAPLGLFVVSFSFVYFVVPLAFWGGTPGMIWSGLVARNAVTEPLSFGQSVLRWLGTWLTWAMAGLPGLLALSGRSLVDRLSGSATYDVAAAPASAG